MEIEREITLTQQVLRINGNLHLTYCSRTSAFPLKAMLAEIGSTMYTHCNVGGKIEGDIYMAFDKLRDYPNTRIEVAGSIIIH